MEPTCEFPKRPMGSGTGPEPLPVVHFVPGCHAGYAGAGEGLGVDPVVAVLVGRLPVCTWNVIRMLRTAGSNPACGSRSDTGAGTGGIALSAGEVWGEECAGLPDEDGAETPASDNGIGEAGHGGAVAAATTEGKIIDGGRVPAMAASSFDVAEVGVAVEDGGGSSASALPGEAGVVGPLVIGESLGVGPCGVEAQTALEAMAEFELKSVVGFVGTGGASVDGSPVGKEASGEGLVERRNG